MGSVSSGVDDRAAGVDVAIDLQIAAHSAVKTHAAKHLMPMPNLVRLRRSIRTNERPADRARRRECR
ncbi:hypothetical protein, partial [Rhizobium johnstonii]|uniref:hypothetical protein n=1 Tax=Rhizobium johnstonii TaxID=3019933 RepID=UPI003F999165